jgi:type I restriction enzyme, S subunit
MELRYCHWILKSPLFRTFVNAGLNSGSLIQHIHTKQLKSFRFPVAPLEEQREIVRLIEDAFAAIDVIATNSTRAMSLLDRLDQAVLSKAFRGDLLAQDPDEEPTTVVLKQLQDSAMSEALV